MFGQPEVPTVDADEASERLAEGALLVDVREPAEWEEARIPGAVLKPMATINEWWRELPTDRDIVVQCRTGSRSAQVVHALTTQGGMTRVWNLAGGIVAWARAGKPVDHGAPAD